MAHVYEFTPDEIKHLTDNFNKSKERMLSNNGSFGFVYKGMVDTSVYPTLPGIVAIKISKDKGDNNRQMWKQEISALCSISDEHVIKLLGHGESDDYFALVYECAAKDLDELQVTDSSQLLQVLLGAASAVEAVHRAGYIHWDVKTNNFLLKEDDSVLLGDFGLATPRDHEMVLFESLGQGVHRPPFDRPESKEAYDVYGFSTVIADLLRKYKERRKREYSLDIGNSWLEKLEEIQQKCADPIYRSRPPIGDVVKAIEDIISDKAGGRKCGRCKIL